ncbi:MAG: VWA domain-containing protein, partial [Myxococcota bacterium]|nr:VWA domain-containing protein [Myxococcota bacterium]
DDLKTVKNRILFQEQPPGGGVHRYDVQIIDPKDPIQHNNKATAGILVEGKRSILLLNNSGQADELSSILTDFQLQVHKPEDVELSPERLSQYQLLILKDVSALRFEYQELVNIKHAVQNDGLGLLMTGGPASFGVGGYIESPLEEILPVLLQTKTERKKVPVAMSVALDRSGSMSMTVSSGVSKMDLANQGTAAAISVLHPNDHISVFAVDTESHLVIADTKIGENAKNLSAKALGIESTGGGIYVFNALKAAFREVQKSGLHNKHIILFADAQDAEQPEGVFELIEQMRNSNTTVSVIALGNMGDTDAKFLIRIATEGGGDIYFSENPVELPQIFAMDTMLSARKAYKQGDYKTQKIGALVGLGASFAPELPNVKGYNISFFKSGAQQGYRILAEEDEKDPLVAHHLYGIGKVGVYTGQIGGSDGSDLVAWNAYSNFFNTYIEGLLSPKMGALKYVNAEQDGNIIRYTIESPQGPPLRAMSQKINGSPSPLYFTEVQEGVYEAETRPQEEGLMLAQIQLPDGNIAYLPPIAPIQGLEFQIKSDPESDYRALKAMAMKSKGSVDRNIESILEGDRFGSSGYPIGVYAILLTVLFFLLEIAQRRWGLLTLWRLRSSLLSGEKPSAEKSAPGYHPPEPKTPTTKTQTEQPETQKEQPEALSAMQLAKQKAAKKLRR